MKTPFFSDKNQIEKWVEAAEGIKENYGIEKALSYLIGEKFCNLVEDLQFSRKMVRDIENERRNPNYNPIRTTGEGKYKRSINWDEECEHYQRMIATLHEILIEFAGLIKGSFEPYEIRRYFESNPRLGALGHVCTEEEHNFLIGHGAVEHSVETEVEDALVLGEAMKYFD